MFRCNVREGWIHLPSIFFLYDETFRLFWCSLSTHSTLLSFLTVQWDSTLRLPLVWEPSAWLFSSLSPILRASNNYRSAWCPELSSAGLHMGEVSGQLSFCLSYVIYHSATPVPSMLSHTTGCSSCLWISSTPLCMCHIFFTFYGGRTPGLFPFLGCWEWTEMNDLGSAAVNLLSLG